MGAGQRIDFMSYVRALPSLVRHPSIIAMPLLAAVIDMVVSQFTGLFTDPLGGFGSGIFGLIVQIIYLFAFGIAVIQANNIQRGYRGGFDDAWEEGKRKASGIILAAIGFQFLVWVPAYMGSIVGNTISIILQLIAYFFLILTIPAAAIGGLPGGLAISGSVRAVRSNPLACIVLAVIFVALWVYVPIYVSQFFTNATALNLTIAVVRAILLAYLAFPFSATYDDIAFHTRR